MPISVALLHLHQLGEKGTIPNHLDNCIHVSDSLVGSQALLCLAHHNHLLLGFVETRTTTTIAIMKNYLDMITIITIMINYLDMISEHVELGIVQFRRLLFDCLQGCILSSIVILLKVQLTC